MAPGTSVEARAFEASPQQKGLWRRDRGAATVRGEWRVAGHLDAGRLEAALAELVARHEVLRTRLRLPAGLTLPVQVVEETAEVDFAVVAGTQSGEEGVAALRRELDAAVAAAAETADGGPWLAVRLLSAGEDRHRLALAVPALLADRAGLRLLVAELATLVAGEGLDEAVQYADLAGWLNGFLEEAEAAEGRDFWRRRLAALPGPPAAAGESGAAAASVAVRLGKEETRRLRTSAEAAGTSPESYLLALWQLLLARLAGSEEVAVAVALEGRGYAELEASPGPLERHLPLIARPAMDRGVGELAAQAAADLAEAEKRQECFTWQLGGDTVARPRHAFAALTDPGPFTAGGTTWSLAALAGPAAGFAAELQAVVGEESVALRLSHSPERLDAAAAGRLLHRFRTLTTAAEPAAPAGRAPLLPCTERRELLAAARSGDDFEPAAAPLLPARLAVHAAATPDAAAVSCAGLTLTYGELHRRARRLAGELRRQGVGRGDRVALLFEPCAGFLVAAVGAWYAGAAYAPLDPEQPEARRADLLAALGARVLVAGPGVGVEGGEGAGLTLRLGGDGRLAGGPGAGAEAEPVHPGGDEAAYVLFTSGSTGRPKPVVVSHRNLAAYTAAVARRLGDAAAGRWAAVSSLAADLGNTALFTALAAGGEALLLARDEATAPAAFAARLAASPADGMKIVPSHLEALLAADEPRGMLPRRVLVLGGEALTPALVSRLGELAPELRLINHYGPTEATVGATTWEVSAQGVPTGASGVPIGRPLPGVTAHAVDVDGEPAPFGAPGELWIGGAGVTTGYLGRPAATAERFVPDPFADQAGVRAYRTGDRVRRHPGGELEFLGRVDRQVKLRGFRIEPGEVEAALATHPAVERSVVAVREADGQRRLVAWVAPADAEAATLRRHLEERVPAAMVPAAFVLLERLPLTANGKVDRAALPDPGRGDEAVSAPYVAPRGAAEEALAAVWSEVLGVHRVGREDNFFALGGDSILSIQVVARANAAGLRLDPRQIFTHQTLAALAALAGEAGEGARPAPGVEAGEVPLTPVQSRFFALTPVDPQHYNQALLLAPRRPVDAGPLAAAVAAVTARHDALRLRFRREGDGWSQRLDAPGGPTPFHRVDLRALPLDRRGSALAGATAAVQAGFDLARGPLFRAVLFDGATPGDGVDNAQRLLLVAHHLVVDGVSWRILLDELAAFHEVAGRGEAPALAGVGTPFSHWAARLAEDAAGGADADEAAYWGDPRRAAARPLGLDGDGTGRRRDAASVAVALEAAETDRLLALAGGAGGQGAAVRGGPEPWLLAALGRALVEHAGGPVTVDREGHGREDLFADAEPSHTVGWLTAVHPLLLELPSDGGPARDLAAVRRVLGAVPRNGVGYGSLRWLDAGGSAEALAALPRAEVIFNYLGRLDAALADGPFSAAPEGPGPQRSPRQHRPYPLEVTAEVVDGRLRVILTHDGRLRSSTVHSLADDLLGRLRALLSASTADAGDAGGEDEVAEPATDLSLVDLGEGELDSILAQVSGNAAPEGGER